MRYGVTHPTVYSTLAGLLIVAWTGWVAWQEPSPGDLAGAHASFGTGSGMETCGVCHGDQGITPSCLGCHEEIRAQQQNHTGYHDWLLQQGHSRCESCHGEHYGSDFRLIHEVAWKRASPSGFSHEHADFDLDSAHDSLACEQCHRGEERDSARSPWERSGYLGLVQDCVGCHENPHGDGVRPACAACHGQTAFRPAEHFDHQDVFPLEGSHADAECSGCHRTALEEAPIGASSLTFGEIQGTRCQDCHENVHRARNEVAFGQDCARCHSTGSFHDSKFLASDHQPELTGEHLGLSCSACHATREQPLAGVVLESCQACHADAHQQGTALPLWSTSDCARCHGGGRWEVGDLGVRRHLEIGFPLAGVHGPENCAGCHEGPGAGPQVSVEQCSACHQDPHRAGFLASCADCHLPADRTVKPGVARMNRQDHARAGFPLEEPHRDVSCQQCHRGEGFLLRFPGRSASDCAACHEDPHRGQFRGRYESCTSCHARHEFQPARFGPEQHAAYPLLGNHRAVACDQCHELEGDPATRKYVGTPQDCASCHPNPHAEQFAEEVRSGGCATCHASFDSWETAAFDHDATGYPLRGRHQDASCGDCHVRQRDGITLRYAGTSRQCTGCHEGHGGQLTGGSRGDCDRCHVSPERWSLHRFDHQVHTAFPLDEAHRDLDCGSCHPRMESANGSLLVRYQPLGTGCQDCHAIR